MGEVSCESPLEVKGLSPVSDQDRISPHNLSIQYQGDK